MKHHADLLTYSWWQEKKERIASGVIEDVFPYPQSVRFRHQYASTLAPSAPPLMEIVENE
jgi:isocitrate dehydrogenase kinase/phosphatase